MATASRISSPGRGQDLPPITEDSPSQTKDQQRKTSSLGFLRRSKSTEPVAERKFSGKSKKLSKAQALEEERRQREAMPKHAPRLPDLFPTPQLETFGGEERPDSIAMFSSQAMSQHSNPTFTTDSSPATSVFPDPYAQTESMTNRGRYSYASSAVSSSNNPRRLRRRKDPTPYNILVIGAKNSGKTSFLNFLRKSLAMPPHKHPTSFLDVEEERHSASSDGYTSHYLETEIDGERVGLTLWDSQGLERNIVDIQLRGVTGFLEGKFEETLREEMKVIRSTGVRDTHIHCTFLVLDPVRLDENIAGGQRAANVTPKAADSPIVGILDKYLDIQVLQTILGKTTVVPIISKADTITSAHMAHLRKAVWESLREANIDPLEVLTLDQEYTSSESADEEEAQPKATQPEVAQPEATESKATQPEAAQPKATESEATQPEAAQLEATEPEATHPEGPKPEATESEETQPEAANPEAEADESQGQETPAESESEKQQEEVEDQDAASERSRKSSGSEAVAQNLPFSILSPDPHSLEAGDEPLGRKFPWGFADPHNPEHCDFLKLKDSVFRHWRSELREASRVIWYENWRTSRLRRDDAGPLPQRTKYGRFGFVDEGRRTR